NVEFIRKFQEDYPAKVVYLSPGRAWEDCAILARSRKDLAPVRSVLEQAGLPVKTLLESSLPLHRVRKFSAFIELLAERKGENRKVSELSSMADDLGSKNKGSPWWRMLEGFLKALVDETADATLPVGWAIDSLYDYIAEQRREKFLGSGFFLGTIHSTKGMEFSHVVILDGDWGAPSDDNRREEERRTLYVGMTRARETLALMRSEEKPNPFLRELKSECFLSRRGSAPNNNSSESVFNSDFRAVRF
ncbi:MAG: 3'-5' exonuclease, partial [Aquabacterium sp.]|uniref:3'-5' exonuclease n=1 Tax=Aquabacterium sp. TaxID=1872578 RepID=UPI002716457F